MLYIIIGLIYFLSQIFKSLLFGWLLSLGSKKITSLSAKANQEDLQFLVDLVEKGRLKPLIEKQFPLENTAEAMKYLMEGHARSKLVIRVSE